MKKKNIIYCLTALLAFSSCEDMFEPSKENTRQLETLTQESNYIYGLLINAYNHLPYKTTTTTDVATDDAATNVSGDTYKKMATGEWRSDNDPMSQWNACKEGVQYANLFLRYVNDVKWAPSAVSKQQMYIDRLTGEALGLRAIFYYHLIQAHGGYAEDGVLYGVPLLTEPEDMSSDYNQPRATFADCVKQIFTDCDAAAKLLPAQYKDLADEEDIPQKYKDLGAQLSGYNYVFGNMAKNLVTAKVVQAVKAQTALLAASPAFRAQSGVTSAEAAKICADVLKDVEFDPEGNIWYKNGEKLASSTSVIPEVLWRADWDKGSSSQEVDNFPPSLNGQGKVNPSQNLVDAFPMANGYPISDARSGYDKQDPYANRDPRLSDDVIYNGSTFKDVEIVTGTYPSKTVSSDGRTKADRKDNINNTGTQHTVTGYYLKKLLREDAGGSLTSTSAANAPHIYPRIRYTELFLAYAEAANDAWGPKVDGAGLGLSAYDVIKMIRQRAGIGVDNGDPYLEECAGSQDKMTELIRNERRIELCFENKRFWDIRRWQLPLDETVKGVQVDKIDENLEAVPENLTYTFINVETRPYEPYQNFGPIPYTEVSNWSALKQNKGW